MKAVRAKSGASKRLVNKYSLVLLSFVQGCWRAYGRFHRLEVVLSKQDQHGLNQGPRDGDDQTATKSQDGQQKLDQAAFPTTDVDVVDPECTKKEREEKHHDRALVSWLDSLFLHARPCADLALDCSPIQWL